MVDILAIGSHPDDLEFGVGGILAKMAARGSSIVMADMTSGEMGTNGIPEIRRKEAEAAAALIGAERVFLDLGDCQIADTPENRLEVVKLIRTYKPRVVLAPIWKGEMTHPDHIATGLIARAACRLARFAKIAPEIPIHKPEGILHYMVHDTPNFIVDVSPYFDTWTQMMDCHKSQMKTNNYRDWNLRYASWWGLAIGKPYAQALIQGNPIEIDDLMHIAKGTREL